MYIAYLCFPYEYPDDEDDYGLPDVEIKFTKPSSYRYAKVIPIAFEVLEDFDAEHYRSS